MTRGHSVKVLAHPSLPGIREKSSCDTEVRLGRRREDETRAGAAAPSLTSRLYALRLRSMPHLAQSFDLNRHESAA
jgi:hypothetical protein